MLMETGEAHVELSSDGDGVKAIDELPDDGAAHGLLSEGLGEGFEDEQSRSLADAAILVLGMIVGEVDNEPLALLSGTWLLVIIGLSQIELIEKDLVAVPK